MIIRSCLCSWRDRSPNRSLRFGTSSARPRYSLSLVQIAQPMRFFLSGGNLKGGPTFFTRAARTTTGVLAIDLESKAALRTDGRNRRTWSHVGDSMRTFCRELHSRRRPLLMSLGCRKFRHADCRFHHAFPVFADVLFRPTLIRDVPGNVHCRDHFDRVPRANC